MSENAPQSASILSIDCGTQSLKAILFSLQGEIIAKEQVFYEPYASPKPGWAEQNAEVYWESLCKACKTLRQKAPDDFESIAGVGISTLRNSMVNLDIEGKPLRPIITWLDQRKSVRHYRPNIFLRLVLKILRIDDKIQKIQCEGKSNWIQQNEPEIWKKTHKYVQVSGFLNFRLTGNYTDSVASQIGYVPLSYRKHKWATPRQWFEFSRKLFPVDAAKLPDLVEPGMEIGKITSWASQQTGLKVGVPVIACGSDKGCETLGMGVIDNSVASLSFGTTATLQTTVKKYMEPIRFIPSFPAAIPNSWNPEIEIFRGFWMISWFKNEFAHKEVLEAQEENLPVEEIMDRMLHKAPAGSMGLVVHPFWGPGIGEKNTKGSIIGFGDVHKKEHIYRAVIEGLAYGLYEGLLRLQKRGNMKFQKIAVSGGASQSDEVCQITSDIFNLTLVRGNTYETSCLGAAIITAYGVGKYTSLNEAVKAMVRYSHTFTPRPENREIYQRMFHEVYRKMQHHMEPLYKKIRIITGYPQW